MALDRLRELNYRLQPWKDPSRDFIEHPTSLRHEEGAKRAGLSRQTICLPDEQGNYQAYDERGAMVGSTVVMYMSDVTECPRFNKCSECPNRVAQTVVTLAQESPDHL